MDPDVMHGEICFAGTRVPLTVLLDNFQTGMTAEDFIAEYPSVSRGQVLAVIEWEQRQLRVAAELVSAA